LNALLENRIDVSGTLFAATDESVIVQGFRDVVCAQDENNAVIGLKDLHGVNGTMHSSMWAAQGMIDGMNRRLGRGHGRTS
jgi:hypothetical protein